MAKKKKNDSTLLWITALAIGGYCLYEKNKAPAQQPAATIPPNTNAVKLPSGSNLTLKLPPSNILNSNQPLSAASASSAPNPAALDTTGLVPGTIINNALVLQPGQTLAINSNGTPVQNTQGIPLVFPAPIMSQNTLSDTTQTPTLSQAKNTKILELLSGVDEGECL